jgi:hypothetical protein
VAGNGSVVESEMVEAVQKLTPIGMAVNAPITER